MNEYVIECHGLTKHYRNQCALNHLDLNIAKGEIFGLIGQNGAGKSTMMKLLAGLIYPSEGEFRLFGKCPEEDPFVYRRIGTIIEQPGIYGNMNAYENMKIKALSMGCFAYENICSLLDICGLDPKNKKKARAFSLGMKQRLGLALAMLGNPEILILDEPVNGLDPQGINGIRKALQRINEERNVTILISSHILEELSKIATSYGIIKDGNLIQHVTKQELEEQCRDYCRIQVDDIKKASYVLEEICHLPKFEVCDGEFIHIFEYSDTSVIAEIMVNQGVRLYEITLHKQNLESYFITLTGGDQDVE